MRLYLKNFKQDKLVIYVNDFYHPVWIYFNFFSIYFFSFCSYSVFMNKNKIDKPHTLFLENNIQI